MSSGGRSCLVAGWWEEGSGFRGCHGVSTADGGFAMGILPSPSCSLATCPRAGPCLSRRSRFALGMQPHSLAAPGEPGDRTG